MNKYDYQSNNKIMKTEKNMIHFPFLFKGGD